MKDKYLNSFKNKTKDELLYIIENSKSYNEHAVAASHELLRKKTATFSEYQELTGGKNDLSKTSRITNDKGTNIDSDESFFNAFLNILKWIGIILFFPLSLVVVGYYRNKKAKAAYYANNRPLNERKG